MIVFEEEESDTRPMVFEKQQRHGVSLESEFKVMKTTKNTGRITAPITFNIPFCCLANM
jgi:glucosamine--fructose-6-phosphate aminotransferase (isomerizing)